MMDARYPSVTRLHSVFLVCLLLSVTGCVATHANTTRYFFYGSAALRTPHDPPDTVSAQGILLGRNLSLTFSPHAATAPRLNYQLDEYLAKTVDGRTLPLEKGDLIRYPDTEPVHSAATIALQLPQGAWGHDIERITAKIHYGQVTLDLFPVAVLPPNPITAQIQPDQPNAIAAKVPLVEPSQKSPETLGYKDAVTLGPPGSIPVSLEMQQELGTALRVEVRWNDATELVSMLTGDQRTYYLLPGQHELHIACHVPFLSSTVGTVKILVRPNRPLRIVIETAAHLTGAELRVKAWQNKTLVLDQPLRSDPSNSP